MVEARNANYATIARTLCFGKRGAINAQPEHAEVWALAKSVSYLSCCNSCWACSVLKQTLAAVLILDWLSCIPQKRIGISACLL